MWTSQHISLGVNAFYIELKGSPQPKGPSSPEHGNVASLEQKSLKLELRTCGWQHLDWEGSDSNQKWPLKRSMRLKGGGRKVPQADIQFQVMCQSHRVTSGVTCRHLSADLILFVLIWEMTTVLKSTALYMKDGVKTTLLCSQEFTSKATGRAQRDQGD